MILRGGVPLVFLQKKPRPKHFLSLKYNIVDNLCRRETSEDTGNAKQVTP